MCAGVICGRALYDWGMLDTAKRLLRRTLSVLKPELERGTPVIGLEPACLGTFRDELLNLFPDDREARRLHDQSVLFSDFVGQHWDGTRSIRPATALVQTHCHHHAVFGAEAERDLLDKLDVQATFLPSGCCGMAGAFGFASDTYQTAQDIGERVLLPNVRAAPPDTLIIADGFSCREQIEQGTGRPALHIAQFINQLRG